MDLRPGNPSIAAPTLVIVGSQDVATPPAAGEAIAAQIPGAKVASVHAAHIANVEQPQAYTRTVLDFLLGWRRGFRGTQHRPFPAVDRLRATDSLVDGFVFPGHRLLERFMPCATSPITSEILPRPNSSITTTPRISQCQILKKSIYTCPTTDACRPADQSK